MRGMPRLAGGAGTLGQPDFFGDQPPSFAPPDPRADRIGVIDVGSNSVRMVVYEGHVRSPATIFNEKVMCGLGADLAGTRALSPRGRQRALGALQRFAALAPGLRIKALAAVATAAVREARDGPDFVAEIARVTGIRLRIASGTDEARLAAKGVLFGNPGATGVVVDLGGASMELCALGEGRAGQGETTPLGPQRLAGLSASKARGEIDRHLAPLAERLGKTAGRLWLVGGAWRGLARAHMVRVGYPLEVLHEYRISGDEALEHARWISAQRPEAVAALPGVPEARASVLPLAGLLLQRLLAHLDPSDIMVSGFGLREGICLDNLSRDLRRRDPLIAACERLEDQDARAPGFGAELARWTLPAFPKAGKGERRLIEAAAHLADVGWRTHPDYRAPASWETVTRSALTDLGHEGRVKLGIALIARYRRHRRSLEEMPQARLLDREGLDWAWRLGLVLRLGSTLSGSALGYLQGSRLTVGEGRLTLRLGAGLASLSGEEVEKRLQQAARAMELEPVLSIDTI